MTTKRQRTLRIRICPTAIGWQGRSGEHERCFEARVRPTHINGFIYKDTSAVCQHSQRALLVLGLHWSIYCMCYMATLDSTWYTKGHSAWLLFRVLFPILIQMVLDADEITRQWRAPPLLPPLQALIPLLAIFICRDIFPNFCCIITTGQWGSRRC